MTCPTLTNCRDVLGKASLVFIVATWRCHRVCLNIGIMSCGSQRPAVWAIPSVFQTQFRIWCFYGVWWWDRRPLLSAPKWLPEMRWQEWWLCPLLVSVRHDSGAYRGMGSRKGGKCFGGLQMVHLRLLFVPLLNLTVPNWTVLSRFQIPVQLVVQSWNKQQDWAGFETSRVGQNSLIICGIQIPSKAKRTRAIFHLYTNRKACHLGLQFAVFVMLFCKLAFALIKPHLAHCQTFISIFGALKKKAHKTSGLDFKLIW